MNTIIIAAHPNIEQSRVNQAMLKAASDVGIHARNLYEEYPSEQIDVNKEHFLMEGANRIVLQFPFYWYSSPSLLKKWIDSVMTHGWAYGSDGTALVGKKLLIATTAGGPEQAYQPEGYNRYPMFELLRPFQAMANLTNMEFEEPFVVHGVRTLSDDDLQERVMTYIRRLKSE